MKKIIALFMAFVMCFLLTGCGSQKVENEKYKDLIDMLENEDFEGAIKEIEKMSEAGGNAGDKDKGNDVVSDDEGELKSVEITLDNWDEYFELRTYEFFSANGFGEFDSASEYFCLVSKDGFKPDCEKSDVTYEFVLTCEQRDVTVDFENKKFIYGETLSSGVREPVVSTMDEMLFVINEDRYGDLVENFTIFNLEDTAYDYVTDIEISRIKGTFYYTTDK